MDTLAKLFGSSARVKCLRLFLFNPAIRFSLAECSTKTALLPQVVRKEIALFEGSGVIKRVKGAPKARPSWILNQGYSHLLPLRELLLNTPLRTEDIRRRLRSVGSVKLIVSAGIFVGDFEGRIDILIVGDKLNQGRLMRAIRAIEADIGKEVRYATLSTADFKYRLGLYDRLIRDVFDYRHAIAFDRLHLTV